MQAKRSPRLLMHESIKGAFSKCSGVGLCNDEENRRARPNHSQAKEGDSEEERQEKAEEETKALEKGRSGGLFEL